MVSFIDAHRKVYGVEPICRVLPIAPSTYHAHTARRIEPTKRSARARRDDALGPEVRRVFEENFRVYGVRKVWRQLRREGFDVARCTVARLMRAMGLAGVIRGKPVRTTISDRAAPCPLDRVNRQFRAPAPNMLWVSDFTGLSGISCVGGHNGKEGNPICPDAKSLRYRTSFWISCWLAVMPVRRWLRAVCWMR